MSENRERFSAAQPDVSDPRFDTPIWRAIKKGLSGGALVGFIVAKFYMDSQSVESPVGAVYGGNVLLVFSVCIGFGAALGAGIGWLSQQKIGDDDRPPPPDVARAP